jgi:tetratricopeptide (TPR) repeat protein
MRSLIIVVGCVVLSAACAIEARAQSDETARYDAFVREAVVEYNAGNWGEARLLFGKAHELLPSARTWRGMGLSDYESKRYVQAIEALEAALDSDIKPLDAAQREEVERALERSLRFVAVYALELPQDAKELNVDGRPARLQTDGTLRLNPGSYTLSLRRASGATVEHSFEAAVGERATLELAADDGKDVAPRAARASSAPSADSGSAWPWVMAGTTVALGVASVALGLLAVDAHDEWRTKATAGEPAADARRDGTTYQALSNVGFGLTAAAAAGTVVLWLVTGDDEDEARDASAMRVEVGLASFTLRGAL